MNQRQRMTWAALERGASTAPALPGYGIEDKDHPAYAGRDPGPDDYNIGGPSEFAEDVHPGPYGDSGAPALPGYGIEDQDHPAHQGQVGRQANLMTLVRKKSAKALRLAKVTLGKKANWNEVEDQAFAFMSMDDEALDASLDRLSGGFLADEAQDPVADFGAPEDNGMMARLEAMEQELVALRRASQNDPKGPTLGAKGKSAEEEKAEEKAVSAKQAKVRLASLFTACDMDNDGFVTKEDWMGPPAVFAALDTDRDGIIAKHEVMAGEVPEAFKKQWDKGDDDKGDDKDDDKDDDKAEAEKAEKKARLSRLARKLAKEIEEEDDEDAKEAKKAALAHVRKLAKKADEDEDEDDKAAGKKSDEDEDDKAAAKKAGKKSDEEEDEKAAGKKAKEEEDDKAAKAKLAFGHLADFDDDEMDMLAQAQFGLDDLGDDGPMACGDAGVQLTAGDEGDVELDEGGDDSDKEASFFATGFDPMGLADGTNLTALDKAAFATVFGGDDAEDEGAKDVVEDEGANEDKKANQRLASLLRPQPRKPSTGVRTVGTQARTASVRNEITELGNLWTSDPDVSGSFS